MYVLISIITAILTFLTVFCAAIAPYKWYKILISCLFSVVVTVLVSSNFSMWR